MTEKEFKEFDGFLNETIFDVNEVMYSEERFHSVLSRLYDYMKMGFEEERVRKHPLTYCFHGGKTYTMEIRHFIVNMMCWLPMTRFEESERIDEKYVLDCSCLTTNQLTEWYNEFIIEPFIDTIDIVTMNEALHESITKHLGKISLDFNIIMGISVSAHMFIDLAERSPEFNEIIHTHADPSMQPAEIEEMAHRGQRKIVELLRELDSPIRPIIRCGEGINTKQLREFAVYGGLKPDMVGNTIPRPIDSNFIVGGLNSVSSFYIDKQAGRKAVVANKLLMGNAGFFSDKIMRLSKNTRLDVHESDCHSLHPIKFEVLSDKHLRLLDKSYYYEDEYSTTRRCVKYKRDKHLIGQTIYVRLPITCGLDGNRVCKTCYGKMHKINSRPGFNQGAFASVKFTNKYQQDTLSTKHMQTTNSKPISFPDIFYEVFGLENNIITLNPDTIEDPGRWSIYIVEDQMVEYDKVEFNSHTAKLVIRDRVAGTEYVVEEQNGSEIFMYQDALDLFKKVKSDDDEESDGLNLVLDVGKLDDEIQLGVIVVENNEITKPLSDMKKLIDTVDHLGCATVDEIVNKIAQLLVDSGSNLLLTHACMILKNLVRMRKDIYESPNFSAMKNPDYVILKMTDALIDSPALTTGLSSQNYKKQFSDPDTYRKHAKASTDVYFRKTLV